MCIFNTYEVRCQQPVRKQTSNRWNWKCSMDETTHIEEKWFRIFYIRKMLSKWYLISLHPILFILYHWISSPQFLLLLIFVSVNFIIDRAIFQYILCLDSDNTRVPFVRKKKSIKYGGTENHHLILAFNFVKWVQKGKKVIWGRAGTKRKALKRERASQFSKHHSALTCAQFTHFLFRCKKLHEKKIFPSIKISCD
jgi:hypothetical protein